MNICILGCGPAGLLAAHACEQAGHHVTIISLKVRSSIPGAVFLHEPIPGLTDMEPDGYVTFEKRGSRAGYAFKVYGTPDAPCSWDLFDEGRRPAWSMFTLYSKLWSRYRLQIRDHLINQFMIQQITHAGFDIIISTIPAQLLCKRGHNFAQQTIYVMNKTADLKLLNGMIYNGEGAVDWYRTSRIFGVESTEATIPFDPDWVSWLKAEQTTGYKPISTDCTCHPGIERVGRFGRWQKGILVHHAYQQTIDLLSEYEEEQHSS